MTEVGKGCTGSPPVPRCCSCGVVTGDNVVGPCPGFALYQTVTENLGGEYRLYNLIVSGRVELS